MNVENFKASDGWLDRRKKQFNVSFKTLSGKGNAYTDEMVTPWEKTVTNDLVQIWPQPDHNADEFGFFYRTQPNKSLHLLKIENCVGGKHSNLRLTGFTAANAVG